MVPVVMKLIVIFKITRESNNTIIIITILEETTEAFKISEFKPPAKDQCKHMLTFSN